MDKFLNYLERSKGIKRELLEIKEIEEKIDILTAEIQNLSLKEKEIKNIPDKVETYKKRLEKLQDEIEKQNAIGKKLEDPAEIEKLSRVLSPKQLSAKILEYSSTLWNEQSTVISVENVRIKVNYVTVLLKFNEILEEIQKYIPSHLDQHVKTVSKLISDYILLYSTIITTVTDEALVVITYAASKKTDLTEKEVKNRIFNELKIDKKYLNEKKIYENISKLSIYEEILIEVKKRVQDNLGRISQKQLERYNKGVFYGTIYHIEDTDRWLCDNLVQKIGESEKSEEITDAEQKGLLHRVPGEVKSILDTLHKSMQTQKISKISKGFLQIVKILNQIGSTSRFNDKKIQDFIITRIQEYFNRENTQTGRLRIKTASLQLADAQAILGMVNLSTASKENTSAIFSSTEDFFIDVADRSFADLLEASEADRIDVLNSSAPQKIQSLNFVFSETVSEIFTGSLLEHIRTMFYSKLLSTAYYTIESSLNEISIEHWKVVLEVLLDLSQEHKEMIEFYRYLQGIYKILSYSKSATKFIQDYEPASYPFEPEFIEQLLVYAFKDPRISNNILNHLEKQQKKE